jgi:hypothetical protein
MNLSVFICLYANIPRTSQIAVQLKSELERAQAQHKSAHQQAAQTIQVNFSFSGPILWKYLSIIF